MPALATRSVAGASALAMTTLTLALLAAACAEPEPARAAVQRIVDDLAAQRYAPATARYRAQEELVLSPAAAPTWRRALDHEDPTVREWAVDALSRIGEPDDIERLIASLDDPFRGVQEAAAAGLIRQVPERAVEIFERRLRSDDPLVVAFAAQNLADLESTGSVPALLELLRDRSADPSVRGVVAESLGRLGDPTAAQPLADVAMDGTASLQLRRNAAEALALLEGPEARRALERLLESDDEYVTDVARRVLGR